MTSSRPIYEDSGPHLCFGVLAHWDWAGLLPGSGFRGLDGRWAAGRSGNANWVCWGGTQ